MADDDHSALTSPTITASILDRDRDRRAPRFSWTTAYEATFFRSLCESVQLGLRDNNTFKPEAWERAIVALRENHKALRESHNTHPNKNHLINKADNARKRFRLWRGLCEDPRFSYNPATRTVTASDDAWKSHIDNEPLSRALRGRPFDHEDFMAILYPDVVGSGGAPKRSMKTRRKGADGLSSDKADTPDGSVLVGQPEMSSQPAHLPTFSSPGQITPQIVGNGRIHQNPSVGHARPTSTAIPPRASMNLISALTPPEETAVQNRKRGLSISNVVDGRSAAAAVPVSATSAASAGPTDKRRKTANYTSAIMLPDMGNGVSIAGAASTDTMDASQGEVDMREQRAMLEQILELLKARPRWSEQAMDIFIRDFSKEDLDLQIKIAEKVLTDENKAMLFCKLPVQLRAHWVMRLREMHNSNRSNQ